MSAKPLNKSQTYQSLAETSGLSKKEVAASSTHYPS